MRPETVILNVIALEAQRTWHAVELRFIPRILPYLLVQSLL